MKTIASDTITLTSVSDIADTAEAAQSFAEAVDGSVSTLYEDQASMNNTINEQQSAIDAAQTTADTAQTKADTAQTKADTVATRVDTVQSLVSNVEEKFAEVERMIIIDPDDPSIKLIAGDNGVKITEDKIAFNNANGEAAYFEGDTLLVENEYITNYYPRVKQDDEWVGNLAWVARTNGHLSLKVVKGGIK